MKRGVWDSDIPQFYLPPGCGFTSRRRFLRPDRAGSPATYHQQLTGPDDVVDAQASTIHFDVAKDLITLQGNSSLKQQSGNISGDRIEYDIKTERVRAQAAESGSSDNNKRITVIIPPAKQTSSDNKTASDKKTSSKKEQKKP